MKPEPVRREAVCPRCRKSYTYASLQAHKPFPFCSARCRDIDLGHWLNEDYAVPGEAAALPEQQDEQEEAH